MAGCQKVLLVLSLLILILILIYCPRDPCHPSSSSVIVIIVVVIVVLSAIAVVIFINICKEARAKHNLVAMKPAFFLGSSLTITISTQF